nr:site-specific integrase [Clostridium intestinale]
MKEILKSYEEYLYDSSKSKNTVLAYVTDITLYSKFLLNTKKIEILESDKDSISEYIKYLISQGKSERSVNRIIISIRNFYGIFKEKSTY